MTVGELRKKLQGLASDVPVELELCDDDGVSVAAGDLEEASAEERCDEVLRFYLWGTHGRVHESPEGPTGDLRLVP